MSDVRVFEADSLAAALAKVKKAFGPDAVILGTRTIAPAGLSGLVRRSRVEITAVPPGAGIASAKPAPAQAPRSATIIAARQDVPPLRPAPERHRDKKAAAAQDKYVAELVANELAEDLARRIVESAVHGPGPGSDAQRRTRIREALARLIPTVKGIDLSPGSTRRVAIVGPPGAGKTTTLAKLAAHFKLRHRTRVALIAADMHRLAAGEQLQRYADLIGMPVQVAQTVMEITAACDRFAKEKFELVLIDTPGLGTRDTARFARVHSLLRAARADETHLVLPATLSTCAQDRIGARFASLGASRLVLTHLDEAAGLGAIVNATSHLNYKLSYFTNGQSVPRDIEQACSSAIAAAIVPHTDHGRSQEHTPASPAPRKESRFERAIGA